MVILGLLDWCGEVKNGIYLVKCWKGIKLETIKILPKFYFFQPMDAVSSSWVPPCPEELLCQSFYKALNFLKGGVVFKHHWVWNNQTPKPGGIVRERLSLLFCSVLKWLCLCPKGQSVNPCTWEMPLRPCQKFRFAFPNFKTLFLASALASNWWILVSITLMCDKNPNSDPLPKSWHWMAARIWLSFELEVRANCTLSKSVSTAALPQPQSPPQLSRDSQTYKSELAELEEDGELDSTQTENSYPEQPVTSSKHSKQHRNRNLLNLVQLRTEAAGRTKKLVKILT